MPKKTRHATEIEQDALLHLHELLADLSDRDPDDPVYIHAALAERAGYAGKSGAKTVTDRLIKIGLVEWPPRPQLRLTPEGEKLVRKLRREAKRR